MTLHLDDLKLSKLVEQANGFQEDGVRALESLLRRMQEERDCASWPEYFSYLKFLDRASLTERTARLLASRGKENIVKVLTSELANSEDEQEAVLGVKALGYLTAPISQDFDFEPLIAALNSSRKTLRDAASIALGRLGRHAARAVEILLAAASTHPLSRIVPGLAFLCENDSEALDIIRKGACSHSREVRLAVARALADATPFPGPGLPLLASFLDDRDPEVQCQSLSGLARASSRFPEAIASLHELACANDDPLQLKALRSLGEAAPVSADARKKLESLVESADSAHLVAIAMGLSKAGRGDLESCLPLIRSVAAHGESEVMTTLAGVLSNVASCRPAGPIEVCYGLIRTGIDQRLLQHIAQVGGDCGTLAFDLVRLWSGEGDQVALLSVTQDTLRRFGADAIGISEVYSLLIKMTHFATIEQILTAAADLGLVISNISLEAHHLLPSLEALFLWIERLTGFETQSDPESQAKIVRQALKELDELKSDFETRVDIPENSLLAHLLGRWKSLVLQVMFATRRGAELTLKVIHRKVDQAGQGRLTLEVHNLGPGVAYDVEVELLKSSDYNVQVGAHRLRSLNAKQKECVEFAFTVSFETERVRVEVSAQYSDFAESGKTVSAAEEITCRTPRDFVPILNPYVPGLPLELGSLLFLGREDVFSFVRANLDPSSQKRCLVLVGQRRMGKTSILKQLPMRLSKEFLTVLVDCQGLEHHGLGNLLYHLAHIIGDALATEGIHYSIPELAALEARPLFTFEYQFLKPMVHALGERRLLLAIDEFQAIEEAVEAGELDEAIFGFFRSLIQHQERLFFIFSGLQERQGRTRDYWQPVFNIALRHEVGLLAEEYARGLICGPVEGSVLYDPLALDQLMELCNGHPYLTQLFCDRLINHLNDVRDNQVRPQNIQEVMPLVFAAGVNHFYSLWEDVSQRGRIVLIAMAAISSHHRFVTLSAVTRFIRERGVDAVLEDVTTVLQQLLARNMIQYVSAQPPGYAFRVNLFRYWIEREMLQALIGGRLKWD